MKLLVFLLLGLVGVKGQENWTQWTSWAPDGTVPTRERERTCVPVGKPVCDTSPLLEHYEACPNTCSGGSFDSSVTTTCTGVCDTGTRDIQHTCSNPTTCLFTQRYPCLNMATCTGTWGEWVETGSCDQNCGGGEIERTRTCMDGGAPATTCLGGLGGTTQTDMALCNTNPCPVIGQWSSLSACNETCGDGTQQRTRNCLGEFGPTVGCFAGNLVTEIESQACNEGICSQWTTWADSTPCSESCSTGQLTQTRTCMNELVVATDCEGSGGLSEQTRVQDCNTHHCGAIYGPFVATTVCNATCDGGIQAFKMRCLLNGMPSILCDGPSLIIERRECNTEPCSHGPYIAQGECSRFCGGGEITELSQCTGNFGLDFRCDRERVVQCNTDDCVYSSWFDTSTCTVPCNGPGTLDQMRNCSNMAGMRSSTCDEQRTILCNSQNCSFGNWTDVGLCSTTCGGGQVQQQQTCSDQDCTLVNNRTLECNTDDCVTVFGAGTNIPLLVILVSVAAALLVAVAVYLLLLLCIPAGAKKVTATTAFAINTIQVGSLGMIQWRGKTKLTNASGKKDQDPDNDIPMVRIFETGTNNSANTIAQDEEINVGGAATYGEVIGLSELNQWAGQMISDSQNIKETDVYDLNNQSNNNFALNRDDDHVTWAHSRSFTGQRPRSTFRPFSRRESSTYTTMK